MPFFESADHYRINGGNFSYSQGDTSDYHYDNSIQVEGQGNSVTNAPQSFQTDNSIINNNCGQMTVFGQGGNANVHVNSFGFQGNNGMFPMFPNSQMQIHVDQGRSPYNLGHTMSQYSSQEPQPRHFDPPYSPRGPSHFDPGMGQPQQFGPDRTTYQSSAPYVNQFPMADVPPAATYPTAHTNVGTRNAPSWSEPPGVVRSGGAVEHPGESGSFYTQSAPPQPPPMMMPVPSPSRASTPLHKPSQVPVLVPLTMPTPAAAPAGAPIPMPSENIRPVSTPISPVTSPSTPSWSSPQERAISPHIARLSVRAAQPEVHRSPSALSQNAAQLNFTTPYAYRAVDQNHAHETPRTIQQAQDEVSMPYSAVPSSPVEARRSERGSSPSPLQRPPPPQRPPSLGAPQIIQTSHPDTIPAQSNQITSSSVASGSVSVAGQSLKTREDRVSPRPSEKAITGVYERELSLDSVPPPAYTLEPEAPFETGEITQEPTSTVNLPPSTGVGNQEYRYSHPITEVVRQDSLPDIILPKKKKKKKQGWRFSEMLTRRSRNNNDPAVEL